MRTLKAGKWRTAQGFSLVELLVALVFTLILMAGMATVFKASLGSFVTSGERLSAARRNRLAMDILRDDLNLAGQYLTQLDQYPAWILPTNPGFWIEPGADAATPDQIHLAFDEALPFEAQLNMGTGTGTTGSNAAAVMNRTTLSNYSTDVVLKVRAEQASYVKTGSFLVFKDAFDVKKIATAKVNGSEVTIAFETATAGPTGAATGSTGPYYNIPHKDNATVVVVKPAQSVRYRIQNRKLDPEDVDLEVPCLVREQVDYGKAFNAAEPSYTSNIITENVSNLKISLSLDHGVTWITGTSWNAIQNGVNNALNAAGRQGYQTIAGNPHWYRDIPALVRVDLTTQTARAREEYSPVAGAMARRQQVESLVMIPRYFGLSYYQ